jgi:septal ring factor EnvC (AmiA/AmiB activator)
MVIVYLLGGSGMAFLVGLLLLPVTWFALGFVGLSAAAGVVMLTVAALLLADTFVEPKGSDAELLRAADADVNQARRITKSGFEAREDRLEDTISKQRKELADMTRRVGRLERDTLELQSALSQARGKLKSQARLLAKAQKKRGPRRRR